MIGQALCGDGSSGGSMNIVGSEKEGKIKEHVRRMSKRKVEKERSIRKNCDKHEGSAKVNTDEKGFDTPSGKETRKCETKIKE